VAEAGAKAYAGWLKRNTGLITACVCADARTQITSEMP